MKCIVIAVSATKKTISDTMKKTRLRLLNANVSKILGHLLLVTLILGSFYTYLLYFRPLEFKSRKRVFFMVSLIVFFVALTAITIHFNLCLLYTSRCV